MRECEGQGAVAVSGGVVGSGGAQDEYVKVDYIMNKAMVKGLA